MPRCRFGRNCRYHQNGNCRFYHSPSPQRCRSRSRSRDRSKSLNKSNSNNKNQIKNDKRVNLIYNDCKVQEKKLNDNTLQFMAHGDNKKWGQMTMKQTVNGLEMTANSFFPTRIGRVNLIKGGKYYFEVILPTKECNARVGWGLHSQHIDDINDMRTGNDTKGWSFNGVYNPATKFWNKIITNYGCQWKFGDVVSCTIDIDQKIIRYYLNGKDLGIAFCGFNTFNQGIAPSISISNGCKVIVVTEKRKFKYNLPSGYRAIETGFKMTWSTIIDRVSIEISDRIGRILREAMNKNIDQCQIHDIIENLPLDQTERVKLKDFVQKQLEFVPIIDSTVNWNDNVDVKRLLEMRGFKMCHIEQIFKNENLNGFDLDESVLNILISKCIEYESNEVQRIHLKNWKNWDCVQVIEWINNINDGHFLHDKYRIFKEYLKREKVNGSQLEYIYDLSLKLLTLNDEQDRNMIIMNLDKLTERRPIISAIEPPKEYLDPISMELMSDPVVCVKSGYTYDRNTILNQIRVNREDPFTRHKITERDLVPNRFAKECIDRWKQENIAAI